jgi:hypothetical protein
LVTILRYEKGRSFEPSLEIWLPGIHDLRTTTPINSITYKQIQPEKPPLNEALETGKTDVVNKPQHIIHKAIDWEKMLDDGEVESLSEIAEKEGLTRARVTQIMNLLKLPPDWKDFLLGLNDHNDHKEIRKYSERTLRNYQIGRYAPPPNKKKLCREPMDELPKKSRGKQKPPPKIVVVEIDEPLSQLNLEGQKKLIQKAVLRKLKKLEDKNN